MCPMPNILGFDASFFACKCLALDTVLMINLLNPVSSVHFCLGWKSYTSLKKRKKRCNIFSNLFPGCRGRLRVLRQASAGHPLLRTQLLRRVRQRGRHDERRRDPHVLIPNTEGTLNLENRLFYVPIIMNQMVTSFPFISNWANFRFSNFKYNSFILIECIVGIFSLCGYTLILNYII